MWRATTEYRRTWLDQRSMTRKMWSAKPFALKKLIEREPDTKNIWLIETRVMKKFDSPNFCCVHFWVCSVHHWPLTYHRQARGLYFVSSDPPYNFFIWTPLQSRESIACFFDLCSLSRPCFFDLWPIFRPYSFDLRQTHLIFFAWPFFQSREYLSPIFIFYISAIFHGQHIKIM
jgi:hypothetical protein